MTAATSREPTTPRPTVAVQVQAGDPGAQIIVFDAAFRTVAQGTGRLYIALTPGIYKARFNTGDRIADVLFEVADAPVTVTGPALSFSSPIPLMNTSTNHEYHYYPSRDYAAKPPFASLGVGGQLFVFARDSRQAEGKPPPGPPQWQGLCIRNANHGGVFDIDPNGIVQRDAGFVTAKLELNPGLYFLEQPDCAHPDMVLKLPFVVSAGWCTHVYVDSKDGCTPKSPSGPSSELRRVLDLAGAAMVMLRLENAAQLDEQVVRLSEIARQGLMRSQEAVSAEDLAEMLDGKREFPMLGLYAAHVLLASPQPDWSKIARLGENLARWLGFAHPDVYVLLRACAAHGVHTTVESTMHWPPLLAASWDLAVANGIGPGLPDPRGDWQRQYRIGGSMWSCLYAPKRLPELLTTRAIRNTSFRSAALTNTSDMVAAAKQVMASVPKPPLPSGPSGPSGASGPSGPSAAVALPVGSGDWKSQLTSALRTPNPDWPPFDQAVRRRVLDLLHDESEPVSLEMLGAQVQRLAEQFNVSADDAEEAFGNLIRPPPV